MHRGTIDDDRRGTDNRSTQEIINEKRGGAVIVMITD
jgi:hypothetical protein